MAKNNRWVDVKAALAWLERHGGQVGQGIVKLPFEAGLKVWACADFLAKTGRYKIVRGA